MYLRVFENSLVTMSLCCFSINVRPGSFKEWIALFTGLGYVTIQWSNFGRTT